jgi:hypothetical protein
MKYLAHTAWFQKVNCRFYAEKGIVPISAIPSFKSGRTAYSSTIRLGSGTICDFLRYKILDTSAAGHAS